MALKCPSGCIWRGDNKYRFIWNDSLTTITNVHVNMYSKCSTNVPIVILINYYVYKLSIYYAQGWIKCMVVCVLFEQHVMYLCKYMSTHWHSWVKIEKWEVLFSHFKYSLYMFYNWKISIASLQALSLLQHIYIWKIQKFLCNLIRSPLALKTSGTKA